MPSSFEIRIRIFTYYQRVSARFWPSRLRTVVALLNDDNDTNSDALYEGGAREQNSARAHGLAPRPTRTPWGCASSCDVTILSATAAPSNSTSATPRD